MDLAINTLTDDLTKSRQRTGYPNTLDNAFMTPPGVADEYWRRLLDFGHTQVEATNPPDVGLLRDTMKFRAAYATLLEHLENASATGTSEQRAVFQTRANLPRDFFAWVMMFGQVIDRETWKNSPVDDIC